MSFTVSPSAERPGWVPPGADEQAAALALAQQRLADARGAYIKLAETSPGTNLALILADQKVNAARALVNDILALMPKDAPKLQSKTKDFSK